MGIQYVNRPIQKSFMYSLEEEKRVIELYLSGASHIGIAKVTQLPLNQIARIIRLSKLKKKAEKLQEDLTAQAIKTKIPLMRKINEVTLQGILEYVTHLSQDKERLLSMSPRDAKDLMNIVTSSAELINLTIGAQIDLPHAVTPEEMGPIFQVVIENTKTIQYEPTQGGAEATSQAGDSDIVAS